MIAMTTESMCLCGCGRPTKPCPVSNRSKGWVKGVPMKYLRGHTLPRNTNKTHLHTANRHPSRTYRAWINMKTRCLNPRATGFEYWGGRGISICERWIHSFENFLADMGE